jgi:hypothetical protein
MQRRRSNRRRMDTRIGNSQTSLMSLPPDSPSSLESSNITCNVDLSHLDITSLKNYKRVFRLRTRHATASKAEMIAMATKHFQTWTQLPSEEEIVETFIWTIKNTDRE